MDAAQKPIIDQLRESMPDTSAVTNAIGNTNQSIESKISGIKSGVESSLADFSKKGVMDAGNEFLNSNGMFAKFAFLLFLLIIFLFLFKVGVGLIGYFTQPATNPYLISGKIAGGETVTIAQDPKNTESIPVMRSNDRSKGIEFTWSVWIYLNGSEVDSVKYNNIFVKGSNRFNSAGLSAGLSDVNGPGLYVKDVSGQSNLLIKMSSTGGEAASIDISGVPIRKWINVIVRLQNSVMDAYINGVISKRYNFKSVPLQNYKDVIVCGNGGFTGLLSDLRYYNYALNVFEINNVVIYGPNTSNSSADSAAATGNYTYLAPSWYKGVAK
jgi:hypothetical protein